MKLEDFYSNIFSNSSDDWMMLDSSIELLRKITVHIFSWTRWVFYRFFVSFWSFWSYVLRFTLLGFLSLTVLLCWGLGLNFWPICLGIGCLLLMIFRLGFFITSCLSGCFSVGIGFIIFWWFWSCWVIRWFLRYWWLWCGCYFWRPCFSFWGKGLLWFVSWGWLSCWVRVVGWMFVLVLRSPCVCFK